MNAPLLSAFGHWTEERMKLYSISGLMRLVRPLEKIICANKPRKKNPKQINKITEK